MNKRENYCWLFGNPWSLRFLDEPPADPPAEPPEPPTGIVTVNGELSKGWSGMLKDESLHGDKTLDTIKNVETLAKSYVHVRKQVPMDKTAIPTEHFTDADWDVWHKAGGRPETAADYNIKRPEEFPETHWSDDRAKRAQDLFHKIGLNKKQSDAIVAFDNSENMLQITNVDNDIEFGRTKLHDGLIAEWGNAYQQKVDWGKQAVDKAAEGRNGVIDEELKERLLKKIQPDKDPDPDLIRAFSNLGAMFSEHGLVETPRTPTPGDVQDKIDEATQHPAYMNGKHPLHEKQVELVNRLIRSKVKSITV